mmetsp:Transcript_58640/g.168392  ORF Transcript_58640/g.168392 Transcript_58640/m.168392 type:complete len:203 (-) Transcript_58640:52-660(-)
MGFGALYATIVALVSVSLGQLVVTRTAVSRRSAVVMSVVLPVACFLIVAMTYKSAAEDLKNRLWDRDCHSTPSKYRLEEAWQAANTLHRQCLQDRAARVPEASSEELAASLPLYQCDGYAEGLATWKNDWEYLASLEGDHHCAGWCESAPAPLWHVFRSAGSKERCSLAAGDVLGGPVYRTTAQIKIYCILVAVLGFLLSLY